MLNKLEYVRGCLRQGRYTEARSQAVRITEISPDVIEGWIFLARADASLSDYPKALVSIQKALSLDGNHPTALLVSIEASLGCGLVAEALATAARLERERKNDPSVVLQVGYCFTRTNRHADAARCYERVRILQPANNIVLHNLAGAYLALGEAERAEQLYTELLHKEPSACEAYYNRATVRKQTPDNNHVAELEHLLAGLKSGDWGEAPICYALAKELEDIGEWDRSFAALTRGAASLHRQTRYEIAADLAQMDAVKKLFDKTFCNAQEPGHLGERPIFIVGMPRTGTTLVDRILSSHSQVGSIGESDEFHRALLRQAPAGSGRIDVARLHSIAWDKVGVEFCRAAAGLEPSRPVRLDKTLTNFLYAGAILKALPGARVIHVRRHPMDACYAIYKTLFRAGLSYSYDLGDLGRYYLGYKAMMEHWQEMPPGRIFTVDYEELVENQEQVSRAMVLFCGLDWEEACLSFEKNASPSFTASAVQVRSPVYSSSVRLWRRYEAGLAPLRRILEDGGCAVD